MKRRSPTRAVNAFAGITKDLAIPTGWPAIRLAIRTEEEWVVAYLAQPETMDGAMKLAVIRKSIFDQSPESFGLWRQSLEAWLKITTAEVAGLPIDKVYMMEQTPRADG